MLHVTGEMDELILQSLCFLVEAEGGFLKQLLDLRLNKQAET